MEKILQRIADLVNKCLGPLYDMKVEGSDVRDLLIQLFATIILFIVIRFLFWKPITNILEQRRVAIDNSLESAKEANENAIVLKTKADQYLKEAKQKVKEMLDKAEKDGLARKEEIINDAKEEARKRLQNLDEELKQEKSNMEKDIRKEIIEIAFLAAEKIAAKEIEQDKYLGIIDDILKEASE